MINQERVKARTQLGGHDVPANKLLSRYDRSLDLLYDAIKMSDRAFLIDNSTKTQEVVAEYERETNSLRLYSDDCPEWVARYFFDKDS